MKLKDVEGLIPERHDYPMTKEDLCDEIGNKEIIIDTERVGNIINQFTREHKKGKEGIFAISHKEGFTLAQAISDACPIRVKEK
jgi:hypothetical protein